MNASRWRRLTSWLIRSASSHTTLLALGVLGVCAIALTMVRSSYVLHFKSNAAELHLHPAASIPTTTIDSLTTPEPPETLPKDAPQE